MRNGLYSLIACACVLIYALCSGNFALVLAVLIYLVAAFVPSAVVWIIDVIRRNKPK